MTIEQIKRQLTIIQVLDHYNLTANKNGMLCCPFHNDKTPSLQIYSNTNTFCCFSSNCNAGTGDVIEFIRLMDKCTKHEAIIKSKTLINPMQTTTNEETLLSRQAILTRYYQGSLQALSRSERAREYLKERNLNGQLGIGFTSDKLALDWSVILKESAVKSGLLKKNDNNKYATHFRNCIIFPMKDRNGHVIDLYGRSVNVKSHFYLPGNHHGLYPSYPKSWTSKLILTEAIIDAATLLQLPSITDHYSILACYGTNGFTSEHEQVIKELYQMEEVIIFFDGDEAGQTGAKKIAAQLQSIKPSLTISQINTPEGEDVNSLSQSHPDESGQVDAEIFLHLIETRNIIFSSSDSYRNEKLVRPLVETVTPAIHSNLDVSNPELLYYQNGVLNVTVLGGIKITGLDKLRVTLKLEGKQKNILPLRSSLDLYHKSQTDQLITQAAEHFDISSHEASHAVSSLINELENYRQLKLESLKPRQVEKRTLSEAEKQEALEYLKKEKLMHRTLQDIIRTGIVGEQINSMIAYLVYTSRKREKPMHLMCLGASGIGKTYLQEKVGQLIPEEDKIEITMLSENAFYYFGKEELKHKLILIEDLDGAENVLYPLRELQSKTSITKTVTMKDNKGNLKTITLKVEGPVSVSSCTTREKIYEDNANRCILLYIDGSAEQDKRIMQHQQQLSAGLINQSEANLIKEKLQNVQRLLRPIKVRNPYAQHINLPEIVFKPRRTMMLLLSFIETITFYHQYQREIIQDPETGEFYIESTPEDIEFAFKLLKEALFSKSDELSGACRKFFEQVKAHLKSENKQSFYGSMIRRSLRLNPSNLKRYLTELMRYGHVKIIGGSKFKGFEYQVADTHEYEKLKSSIDQQFEAIMQAVRKK